MHKLYELKEKLMSELEDYSENGKFSKEDVESIKYIASSIDHLCNIMESGDEYSMRMSYDDGGMMGRGSYDRGGSYARGRSRGGSRGGRTGANQYGSYDMGGYSRGDRESIVSELRTLMEDAPDEKTRSEFRRFIQKMEQM